MLVIVSKNVVYPDKKQDFLALASELVAKSRAEAGCIEYSLYEDVKDPNVLTYVEKWEDQAAIDRHNASEHFQRIVPQLAAFKDKALGELRVYRMVELG